MEIKFVDNKYDGAFYLYDGEKEIGVVTFIKASKTVINVNHTYVSNEYSGQGLGKNLFDKVVEYAKENNLTIIPTCPFIKRSFDKDESLSYLLKENK